MLLTSNATSMGGASVAASGTDHLEWDEARQRCISRRHLLPVGWSAGLAGGWWNATPLGEPVPRACCSLETLLQAEWYSVQNCSTCKYGH